MTDAAAIASPEGPLAGEPDLNRKWIGKAAMWLWLILFGYFSAKAFALCFTALPSFDGAMNLEVPRNLIAGGGYSPIYHPERFSHIIQTGPTVLLPTALLFRLAGISTVTGQVVSAFYLVILLAVVSRFVWCATRSHWAMLAGLLLTVSLPDFFRFGHHVYGEIPALAFLLTAFMALDRAESRRDRRQWLCLAGAGALFGLAYLTKTVMLIAVPGFAAAFLLGIRERRRLRWWSVFVFVVGFCVPVGLFEVYKLSQLQGEYLNWWRAEILEVGKESGAGSGLEHSPGFISRLPVHWRSLCQQLNAGWLLSSALVLSLGGVVAGLLYRWRQERQRLPLSLIIAGITMLCYFSWWLLIASPQRLWLRRLMDGLILLEIMTTCMLYWLRQRQRRWWPATAAPAAAAMVLILIWSAPRNWGFPVRRSPDLVAAEKLAETIRSLPADPRLFGLGWWRAPNISLLLQRPFEDLQGAAIAVPPASEPNAYLVVDPQHYFLDPHSLRETMARYETSLVRQSGNFYLYRIHSVRLPESSPQSPLSHFVDFAIADYDHVTGLYPREQERFRWSQRESVIVLQRDREPSLLIAGFLPAAGYRGNVRFRVIIGEYLVDSWEQPPGGGFSRTIPLPTAPWARGRVPVILRTDQMIQPGAGDQRQLAFVLSRIGFVDTSEEEVPQ